MASTAKGVDDPSGNQRGAAGEGEPVSFRERSGDPTDLLLQGTQHATLTPRRASGHRAHPADVVPQRKFWHKSTSSAGTT